MSEVMRVSSDGRDGEVLRVSEVVDEMERCSEGEVEGEGEALRVSDVSGAGAMLCRHRVIVCAPLFPFIALPCSALPLPLPLPLCRACHVRLSHSLPCTSLTLSPSPTAVPCVPCTPPPAASP